MKHKCNTCKYQLNYLWIGEGYRREVHSCKEHLPMYTENCKCYKKREKE